MQPSSGTRYAGQALSHGRAAQHAAAAAPACPAQREAGRAPAAASSCLQEAGAAGRAGQRGGGGDGVRHGGRTHMAGGVVPARAAAASCLRACVLPARPPPSQLQDPNPACRQRPAGRQRPPPPPPRRPTRDAGAQQRQQQRPPEPPRHLEGACVSARGGNFKLASPGGGTAANASTRRAACARTYRGAGPYRDKLATGECVLHWSCSTHYKRHRQAGLGSSSPLRCAHACELSAPACA